MVSAYFNEKMNAHWENSCFPILKPFKILSARFQLERNGEIDVSPFITWHILELGFGDKF